MLQREQDFSDGCPTTYVALSSPTCTSPMYAQRWNTQAPSGMVPFVTKMHYNLRESKQQSLAESCMPHGTLRKDNFLKNSTGLLFDGVENIASLCLLHQLLQERPDPLSGTLPQYASTSNTRSPRKPKELILANARTTRYSKSFFFRTSVVWNTLPGHLQQLTSPHQFKLAIREHFHARKFNCLHNFSLTP